MAARVRRWVSALSHLSLNCIMPSISPGLGASQHSRDVDTVKTVGLHLSAKFGGVIDAERNRRLQGAGKGCVEGPASVFRQRRVLPTVGDDDVARVFGIAEGMEGDPIGPPVTCRLAEGHRLNLHVALVENPIALFQYLPDHVADHLLDAVNQNIFAKLLQKLLLDALDGRLSELRGRLQASDSGGLRKKRPNPLTDVGLRERGEFLRIVTKHDKGLLDRS
ncbi:bll8179 [Bradyrhizobium diazoefficiens USDA 110]|uniref:Bll8179 protein n=2 Tax=Bradyrhizobium TaxID=374 RepID=Q89BH3_BRADU|nr:hypothetical protein CIT37_15640 [Bradyrhizobium ottawaense]MYV87460.1 hypothetical protein [Bradyrhizobium japonicum]NLS73403.1 hypothetical protein [Bradyrhizobium brasilense]NWL43386.1 hypothetical protein [Bradyrhizobium elkanii]PDT56482.1 hypothetical protein CO678_38390 [Bradyrhizobium diazoefficiens]QOZ14486.1 hypothetical protein XI02_05120 [Bradyrhizobium sp. CCBAU 21365]BAC53444.1 bll8179 [Bradyrhizobium diazoefficiens USDA 110]